MSQTISLSLHLSSSPNYNRHYSTEFQKAAVARSGDTVDIRFDTKASPGAWGRMDDLSVSMSLELAKTLNVMLRAAIESNHLLTLEGEL